MGIINKPHTFSPSTTASSSEVNADFDTLYNEFNGNIAAANLATDAITTSKIADSNVTTAKIADSNVTTAKINDDAVTAAKIDWAATGANGGIWWEELGRTTLSGAGDTVSVTSLPARKYLKVIFRLINSGSINSQLQFNTDAGANYAYNNSIDGAASGTAVSQASVLMSGSGSVSIWGEAEVFNLSTEGKFVKSFAVKSSGAAAGTPIITLGGGAWGNTSNAISSIQVVNTSTGDYAIGSEVVVLGHN